MMILNFNLATILIIFASAIQATSIQRSEQAPPIANQEELVELVLKDLKDALQSSGYHSLPTNLQFDPIRIPKLFKPNQKRIAAFLKKPIDISEPKSPKIRYTEIAVTGIFKYLEERMNSLSKQVPKQYHRTMNEYFLMVRMNKAIYFIKSLLVATQEIRNMEDSSSKSILIQKARNTHSKLYHALLQIRISSFLDSVDSTRRLFDSATKFTLASNVYSIGIGVLRNTMHVLI